MRTVNSAQLHPVSFQTVLNPNVTRYAKIGPVMTGMQNKSTVEKEETVS
jgi:hypothetical protein